MATTIGHNGSEGVTAGSSGTPAMRRPLWHRLNVAIAGSRAGAWVSARTLHHLDRLVARMTRGRATVTSLCTGLPLVWLTTTGAKSGLHRTVPVLGIEDGNRLVVIASNWGRAHHPAWFHNVRAHPSVTVKVHGRNRPGTARVATKEEYAAYWPNALAVNPGWAAYRERTQGRQIPMLIIEFGAPA